MRQIFQQAQTAMKESQQRQKTNCYLRARAATLIVGERVLVRVVAYDGKHKIADKWEDHPYLVIEQPNKDVPVFKVRQEYGERQCRVVHCNSLLHIGSKFTSTRPPRPTPRPRQVARKRNFSVLERTNINVSFTSDSGSGFFIDNSIMARCSQQDTPSQYVDDLSLSREASELGSKEDALQQDEPVDQTEDGDDDDVRDDLSEDTAPSFDTESDTDRTLVPTPRRYSRQRHVLKWTKHYVMMTQTQPDLLHISTFVKEMMKDGLLRSLDSSVCYITLLNIVWSSR
jgi:hypothetical protein